MEVSGTFFALLSEFRCVFTAPSYWTLLRRMTGWVLTHRRRFVTDHRRQRKPRPDTIVLGAGTYGQTIQNNPASAGFNRTIATDDCPRME